MRITALVTGSVFILSGCQTTMYLVAAGADNISSAITSKNIQMTYEKSQSLPPDGEIIFTTDDKTADLRGTGKMRIYYKAQKKNKVVNNMLYVDITDFPLSETNVLHFRLPEYKGYYVDSVHYYGQFRFLYESAAYAKKWPDMVNRCQSGDDYGHFSDKLCIDYVNSDNVTVRMRLSAVPPQRPPENLKTVQ